MMNSDPIEFIRTLISVHFLYNLYPKAIEEMRKSVFLNEPQVEQEWSEFKTLIQERALDKGLPLSILTEEGNIPLDKHSDDEAYKWLDLMIKNIEKNGNAPIEEY
jgi:hypothetical protein